MQNPRAAQPKRCDHDAPQPRPRMGRRETTLRWSACWRRCLKRRLPTKRKLASPRALTIREANTLPSRIRPPAVEVHVGQNLPEHGPGNPRLLTRHAFLARARARSLLKRLHLIVPPCALLHESPGTDKPRCPFRVRCGFAPFAVLKVPASRSCSARFYDSAPSLEFHVRPSVARCFSRLGDLPSLRHPWPRRVRATRHPRRHANPSIHR